MDELNELFRKRVGISKKGRITFEHLDTVLEKTAKTIPFENLCIIENRTTDITKGNLVNKMLMKNEGGLCYELNSILYFFLEANGFNVNLVRGVIFNHEAEDWLTLGRTHVAILLNHENETFLVDTGFGGNLPLRPVPLNGRTITSNNGEFRVSRMNNKHGDYILEMKIKHKDQDWRIGYTFDSKQPVQEVSEFNEIQKILIENEESPFNKNPLVTQLTAKGNKTLTDTTFTEWVDGELKKDKVDNDRFKELAKLYFGLE
ncbi:N-hydroxyarylamine O-acetyltransferase [Bacillus pakistanensis]|uniref:N-hydroxyarylamine O-acetyltransferase n=1 Tax=Rossellomorea pakistanensis TaxID=992288 RepID=A0ABS2N7B4_9BACI|nr:arylamine N-acetyltransferase [Bacillus pakistanensis]MBM7583695.1 N-hydroxyarylamine O-acetyltransferase [Bacillus pakistanensis]